MGSLEFNGLGALTDRQGLAEAALNLVPGVLPPSASDSNDGLGASWESAWIDLGGEG